MQRLLLGITAAILTLTGAALLGYDPETYAGTASVCLRSGLVLGALALALPQVKRLLEFAPPWFLACLGGGLLLVIRWPRSIGIVLPLLIALWFLGPRRRLPAATQKKRAKAAASRR